MKAPVFSMAKLTTRRHVPRAGDEVDRRGDGDRPRLQTAHDESAHRRAGMMLPPKARCSSRWPTSDKPEAIADQSGRSPPLGYRLYATEGTAAMIEALGLPSS